MLSVVEEHIEQSKCVLILLNFFEVFAVVFVRFFLFWGEPFPLLDGRVVFLRRVFEGLDELFFVESEVTQDGWVLE